MPNEGHAEIRKRDGQLAGSRGEKSNSGRSQDAVCSVHSLVVRVFHNALKSKNLRGHLVKYVVIHN